MGTKAYIIEAELMLSRDELKARVFEVIKDGKKTTNSITCFQILPCCGVLPKRSKTLLQYFLRVKKSCRPEALQEKLKNARASKDVYFRIISLRDYQEEKHFCLVRKD